MAGKNTIKGLTVEIGGDTTQLGKALDNVEKKSRSLSGELGQINRLLKMDPGNADLLAQKQQVLADAVDNTSKKLATLKEAEKQVQAQFERGEVSAEQVRELQRAIIDTEKKLSGYQNAAKETAEAIEQLGSEADKSQAHIKKLADRAKEAEEAGYDLGDTLNGIASTGLAAVGGAVTAAIAGLTAAAEATRDYRMETGKLDTAFTDSGFSSEAATGAYRELVGILGETDQSVEAANHLAKLVDNEKDLASWTGGILPGVFATFGDSLPIEGLTEAANETAKVGAVTGPLADALNWAGISEDAFNESLEKCTSEQERQALITETLAGLYGEASAAYKATNAEVIAANQANDAWTASLAEVGAAVEPLITQVKNVGATLLSDVVPVIQLLLNNLPTIGVALAGITAALVSYKVAALATTAATQGMTLAQYALTAAQKALNAAMKANPIGLVILAITALAAAFTYLWKNSESFREFWINLWKKIQNAVSVAVEFFKTVPAKIYNAILGAITKVQAWGTQLVNKAKTAATNMLNNVASTLRNLPSRVWSAISGAIQQVANWGSQMINKAKSAMSNVVSSVTNTLKTLPSKVLSIGGDLVSGLWNGVSNKLQWLKNKISGFASSVLGSIKDFFGVHSPSTETAWIGDMLDQGLAEGLLDNMSAPVKAMKRVSGGVLDAANSVDGMAVERGVSTNYQAAAQAAQSAYLADKLDLILAALERGQIIALDGKKLVGATADIFDSVLGRRRILAERGAQ